MNITTFAYIIFLLGFLGLGFMHEQVHVQIYKGYGIDSHTEFLSHFPDFVTIADKPCPTEQCELAHNINEVVGYHLQMIYAGIGLLLIIIIMLLEIKYINIGQ